MFWTEPFFNFDFLTEKTDNLKIEFYQPEHKSKIFKPTDFWDKDGWTSYFNLVQLSKKKVFMYYRAYLPTTRTSYHHEHTCILISEDGGFTFTKPNINLIGLGDKKAKIEESKKNNIIWKQDAITHNFFAFNNHQEKNKINAIGGVIASSCRCCGNGTFLLESNDGINFEKNKVVLNSSNSYKQGYPTCYDTLNCVTWDYLRQEYRVFMRYNFVRGKRCIQTTTSKNLIKWNKGELLKFKGNKYGYYYIPSVVSIPETGYFLGFPSVQSGDKRSSQTLDFLFSRDGIYWDILKNNFLGKKSEPPDRFIPQILLSPDKTKNMIYINNARKLQVDLYTIRKNGLASLSTIDIEEAKFTTVPIFISATDFHLNYHLKSGGHLQLYFYLVQVDSNNRLSKIGKLVKKEVINNVKDSLDSLDHIIKLPQEIVNQFIIIKVSMKNGNLYTYSFNTKRENMLTTINTYNNSNSFSEQYLTVEKGGINIPPKVQKSPRDARSPRAPRVPRVPKKSVPFEELDLTHLNNLNKQLLKSPQKIIKYKYIDLLKEVNLDAVANVDPMIIPAREYIFKRSVKQIDQFEYSNFNDLGGGCLTYGRTLSFQANYSDGTSEKVFLIKNSKSNCKVIFE